MIELLSFENLVALVTLAALEIVLGIDNLVVIAILSAKLPKEKQAFARRLGLGLAMGLRILLLLSISWIMGLTEPWFNLFGHGVTGRDLVLICGGAFLIYKATKEIHHQLEGETATETAGKPRGSVTFGGVIAQILLLDLVFSLDSVITAIGMAKAVPVMIIAIIIAVLFMMAFAGPLTTFINKHPTVKMLALSFLLLIGFTLVMDGMGKHIEKGYIYSAMGFSLVVEMLNLRLSKGKAKVHPLESPAPSKA